MSGAAGGPVALALALAVALAGAVSGCAHAPAAARPDARLTVQCSVPLARVYVDDRFVGRALELAAQPLSVASGLRRVELRAEGYFDAFAEVTVAPRSSARLAVELRRVPDNEPGG